MTVTVSPAFASAPVPAISSLVSSLLGAGPEGGVTFGSLDSGPLVGVLAVAVLEVLVLLVLLVGALDLIRALSELFSLPTVMVLEPPEPQPAITTAAPSATTARLARERRGEENLLK